MQPLQLELHIYNPSHNLLNFLRSKNIVAQAYSPLGSTNSPLLTDETATSLAEKYNLKVSDILLGYLGTSSYTKSDFQLSVIDASLCTSAVAKDIVVLPKSVTPARIASNFHGALEAGAKLKANPDDLAKLDGLAAAGKQLRFVS